MNRPKYYKPYMGYYISWVPTGPYDGYWLIYDHAFNCVDQAENGELNRTINELDSRD